MFKIKGILTTVFCLAMLLTNGVVRAQESQDTLFISLDTAIEIALEESNTIKIADLTIKKTGYAKKGSYAALYPNISVSGSYQRTLKKQVMAMEFQGQAMEIEVGKWNNVSAGVTASMPLINAELWQSMKLSALDVEIAVEQARSSKISMISQVKKAYYAVLLAKQVYDVYKQVYDNAAKNLERTEQNYNAGKSSEYEYLRAQVNVKNAEPNMYSAMTAIDLAIWQLKAVMGVDLEANIGVVGNIDQYKDEMLAFSIMSENINLDNNSTLIQLQMQEQQIERTVKMTKYHYIPTLAASFSYNYMAMGDDFKFKWYPYSVVGLSLNIPIFDGFSTSSNIRQYKAAKNIMQLNREDTERNLKITLKNYENQITTCMKNYAAAESTVEVAQRSYDIAERMYELGKATLLELNDAMIGLVQAQLTMSQAVYSFMVTKSSIEELEGNDYTSK
ncbi:MAG: TolC family protein [Bacteroidales bacterium]|nr:TolC family protein [Bacteroidales bacterium]